jgi:hypothetical protein
MPTEKITKYIIAKINELQKYKKIYTQINLVYEITTPTLIIYYI